MHLKTLGLVPLSALLAAVRSAVLAAPESPDRVSYVTLEPKGRLRNHIDGLGVCAMGTGVSWDGLGVCGVGVGVWVSRAGVCVGGCGYLGTG